MRGRKPTSRDGWLKPGGELPPKWPGLSKEEAAHYRSLREAVQAVGVGGKADGASVALAAQLAARIDLLRSLLAGSPLTVPCPGGGVSLNPLMGELGRTEAALHRQLASLLLVPRSRSATRLPAELQAQASGGHDEANAELIRLLG